MEDVKIKLSTIWAALMLTYLLGDVLRIFSGDFTAGQLGGLQISQELMLGMAALLVIPAVMVFLSVTLKRSVNRWINIIFAIFLFCLQPHRIAHICFSLRPILDKRRTNF